MARKKENTIENEITLKNATFEQIKDAYNQARKKERDKLVNALSDKGFKVVKGGSAGKGRPDYTNHGTINQYDLSNWKWVACSKDGFNYFISFQAFDKDVKSKNRHVLFDRIGVYKYKGKYNAYDAFYTMENANIDLPLDDKKIQELVEFMENLL
ncbi:MAG: hypothetical protein ACI4JZ_04860 [Oscillospiraceae bacterium]